MEQISNNEETDEILLLQNHNYKEKIIYLFKKNSFGLTVADISKEIGITRHTVSIILAELRGAGLVEIRRVGMAKIHVLRRGAKRRIDLFFIGR